MKFYGLAFDAIFPILRHILRACGPGYYGQYGDSRRAGRYEDRIPVGATFSAPI